MYYVQKRAKITLHYSIVTLQIQKIMLFNAEVKYAKLKIKIKYILINIYSQFTVTAIIAIHLLIGLKFYTCIF